MIKLRRKSIEICVTGVAILLCLLSPVFSEEATKESLYVGAQWLQENLDKVVVIDARPKTLYEKGHIPGAVNAEWTYFANVKGQSGTPGWGEIFEKDKLAQKIGALGIDGKKPVIAYADPGGWGQDGWVVWIMRLSGIENARMLEGGFSAWRAAGGKVSTTSVTPKARAFKIPSFQGGYKVTTPWLKEKLDEVVVIDVRTPFEYKGARIFQEKRGGHIPGALNIPLDSVFREDQTVKSVEEIRTLMASYGISQEDEIVVYDTAGVRSAYMVMVLRMAGFEKVRNYDSSFHEWAGNMDLEVVEGDMPGRPTLKTDEPVETPDETPLQEDAPENG